MRGTPPNPAAASRGHLPAVERGGGRTVVASPAAEHRLQARRPSSCGLQAPERRLSCCARAQLLRGMRDPPGPGIEPVSPALAGGFSATAPPGKHELFSI